MSQTSLAVSSTLLGVGASSDMGASQNNTTRSFSLDANATVLANPNGLPYDQIAVLASADNFATDSALLGYVTANQGITNLVAVARYLRTVRVAINNASFPSCVAWVQDMVPSGGGGANAVVANGGQALGIPWVVGPSDANSLTLVANAVQGYLQTSGGNVTVGTTTASSKTAILDGAGGQVNIGGGTAVFPTTADSIQLRTATNGAIQILAAGTGAVTINSGTTSGAVVIDAGNAAGAVSIATTTANTVSIGGGGSVVSSLIIGAAAAGTVSINTAAVATTTNVGTGAAAQTTNVGSNNTTSTTKILGGSGGIGVGVAAPGASGVTVDTPAVGTILIGNTNATVLTLGGAACATIGIGTQALATAITIGNVTSTTAVVINAGTGANSWNCTGAGTILLASGTGASGWTVGAAGTLNIANDANAHTVNIASGAAAQTLVIGSTNSTSATRLNGGSGGIGIGIAAPGSSGVSIDTPAVGTILIGGTNATVMTFGNTTAGNINTLQGPWAYGVQSFANVAGGGVIGTTAAASVNISSFLIVNQTTAAQTYTLANPTGAAAVAGRRVTVMNSGSTSFTIYGAVVAASGANSQSAIDLIWDNVNTRWVLFQT